MSADIFGERFVSRRLAAWHPFGRVVEEDLTAREAYERMGPYRVALRPLVVDLGDTVIDLFGGTDLRFGRRAIVRWPTEADAEFRVFGVVGPGYRLLTPEETCEVFDRAVGRPVETIGALGRGERLFITTKLPAIDVKGDEVELYLALLNPMTGGGAAMALKTPVRVVCANTFVLAERLAVEQYRVVHDEHAAERLERWLKLAYEQAVARVAMLREALEVLADRKVTNVEARTCVARAWQLPAPPRRDCPPEVYDLRVQRYEATREALERRREAALRLFGGDGTGMDHPACAGTAYGLYNAVVEVEDFRRTSATLDGVTESILFGERAAVKRRAYSYLAMLN